MLRRLEAVKAAPAVFNLRVRLQLAGSVVKENFANVEAELKEAPNGRRAANRRCTYALSAGSHEKGIAASSISVVLSSSSCTCANGRIVTVEHQWIRREGRRLGRLGTAGVS